MSNSPKRATDLTPEQLSRLVMARKRKQEAAPASGSEPIERRAAQGPAPLSFAQQRLWLLDQLEPGNAAYNLSFPAGLLGDLDAAALARCLTEIVRRHEALRTRFAVLDGSPVQVIEEAAPLQLSRLDLSALPSAVGRRESQHLATVDFTTPFDLARGPLMRAALASLGEREHLLLLSIHHVVSDGWSFGIFFAELSALYSAFVAGRPSPLPELPIQYADFSRWQREWLRGPALEEQLAYWRKQLAGAAPALELPTDRLRPAVQTHRGAHLPLRIAGDLSLALKELSRRAKATLFMTLFAGFTVLLHRWAGQDDVVVGAPSAGRRRVETEGLIGFFLNTLVLRTDLSGNPDFLTLLGRVREVILAAYSYQEVPFEKLLEELQPERQLSRSPFFQVLFNMITLPAQRLELPGLTVAPLPMVEPLSKFDFTLYVEEREGEIRGNLVYNVDLFDRSRMVALLAGFEHLLAQAVAAPETPIEALSLVAPETAGLLPDPRRPLPESAWPGPVHGRVPLHAAEAASRLAVADAGESWTYGELEARANSLAHRLLAAGVGQGEAVAIYAHRSASLPWAVLATLKAGAAFLILDPAYPPARLAEYLEIARPAAFLALAQAGAPAAEVEAALAALPLRLRLTLPPRSVAAATGFLADLPAGDPGVPVGPDDVACITFTSGSTGRPKGVLGRHGPLSQFQPWWAERFALTAADRFAMLSALSHDPLQRDVLTPLWLGAELRIPDPERLGEPGWLAGWAAREAVTVLHLTPAMLEILTTVATGVGPAPLPALRRAFVVGDLLKRSEVERLQALAPALLAVNLYGSTETQRSVAYSVVPRRGEGPAGREVLPLGRGIEGVELLVVNPVSGLLAGIAEVGEILVRSRGLARGYLGDEAAIGASAARFLTNPFRADASDPADRVYKTGDLGRYRPDGEVEFAGRVDQQLKIRGFRIEPGEIEAALRRHPAVRECVVVARGEGVGRRLAAYAAPREGISPVPARDLRAFLVALLPDSMVPADFVWLDALPMTPTGKIDRRALPAPAAPAGEGERAAAPRNPTEELLAGIWLELLGGGVAGGIGVGGGIGIDDNFFALGGHSLLATRVLSRIREALGVEIPLRALFEAPTIAGLALAVERGRGALSPSGPPLPPLLPLPAAERGSAGPGLPLSFAQQRLWVLDQLEPGSFAQNLSAAVRLHGALAVGALARAVGEIERRHEALRTIFVQAGDEPRQVVVPAALAPLPVVDLAALPAAPQGAEVERLAAADARRPFELARGPLSRTTLLRLSAPEHVLHVLLLATHHIVTDGWSMGIFTRELSALYAAFAAGEPSPLPDLAVQYGDFAVWQRRWLAGEVLTRQLDYWRGHLAGAPPFLALPTDRPRPPVESHRGARRYRTLPRELAAALAAGSRHQGVTLFMTLLAGFAALLARYSNEDDLVIGTPIANRSRRELEDLIGFFANTLALRADAADAAGDPSFAALARRVRETAFGAYAHQDLPFERLVDELQPERDLGHAPIFQVLFILQNAPPPLLALGDLRFSAMEVPTGKAQFDLTLTLVEIEGELLARLEYATDLFEAATAERLLGHYETLLAGAMARPEGRLWDLPLLSAVERQELLAAAGEPPAPFPADATIDDLFLASARRAPEAVAITFQGESWQYGELAAAVERLARHLVERGVGPEVRVGLCARRSPALLVGLLAVLRAGGAYVPLDPTHPRERLAHVLADSGVAVLLTESALLSALPPLPAGAQVVDLDGDLPVPAGDEPGALPRRAGPENLAYVLYTSGSTGLPKGVAVRHRGVVNYLTAMARRPGLTAGDAMLALTTLSFDIAVTELLLPLAVGARIALLDRETAADAALLAAAIETSGATAMQATPATWTLLLEGGWNGRPGLTALSGGEALPRPLADRLLARVGALWNVYGPTETTVWSALQPLHPIAPIAPIAPGAPDESPVSIGRPLANTTIHLLDRAGGLTPPGVPGELAIGGEGLARGYFGRPDLTAERFVPDPFAAVHREPGGRLYKTGDLARRRPDGDLDFLGRLDHQVKVRGFRIELGEIEAVLARHPGIARAAVVVREAAPGERRLVAFFAAEGGVEGTGDVVAELRSALAERLPEYMIPAAFVALAALPLTPNGKVDRRALSRLGAELAPDRAAIGGGEYVAPRNATEEILAGLWAEVLGLERVGVLDNFFALGGDSILVIRTASRARQAGLRFTPRQLFQNQTVAALANVANIAGAAEPPAPPTPRETPRSEGAFTPSHFPAAGLAQNELDDLLAELAVDS